MRRADVFRDEPQNGYFYPLPQQCLPETFPAQFFFYLKKPSIAVILQQLFVLELLLKKVDSPQGDGGFQGTLVGSCFHSLNANLRNANAPLYFASLAFLVDCIMNSSLRI